MIQVILETHFHLGMVLEIDKVRELETHMVSLFGDLNWAPYDGKLLKYLSTGGIPIVQNELNHFRMFIETVKEICKNNSDGDAIIAKQYFLDPHDPYDGNPVWPYTHEEGNKIVDKFLNLTGVVRLNLEFNKLDSEYRDFNIESYHVLTDLQRKFLLNIIEMDNIGLDKVYVDDYSQEQLVKKQLEL